MTGKLFDAPAPNRKTSSREAVEGAIQRAKGGSNVTWDIPHKQSGVPHWDTPATPHGDDDKNSK
jgi:hypothetical protein